jgi:tetratricopeptide (TPR) repeat protein
MQRPFLFALCLFACACHPRHQDEKDPLAGVNALIASRDYAGAVKTLEDMRAQKGDDPQVALLLMELYDHQSDPARAILRGRAALTAHPDAKALYIPLAQHYTMAQQYTSARDLLLEARKVGVDDKDVAFQLGTCLANLNDTAGARAEYERAQAEGFDEQQVQYNLALVAVQEQDRARARTIFEGIVAKHPDYYQAKRELAHVILDQAILDSVHDPKVDVDKVNQAMNMLWDVKEKLKDDWRVCEAMGNGWFLLGDYDAALLAYTDALKFGQNPKSVEDHYRMAKMRQNALAKEHGKDAAPQASDSKPK